MNVNTTSSGRPQLETELIFRVGDAAFSVSGDNDYGWTVTMGDVVADPLRYASIEEVMFVMINFAAAAEVSV